MGHQCSSTISTRSTESKANKDHILRARSWSFYGGTAQVAHPKPQPNNKMTTYSYPNQPILTHAQALKVRCAHQNTSTSMRLFFTIPHAKFPRYKGFHAYIQGPSSQPSLPEKPFLGLLPDPQHYDEETKKDFRNF